MQCSAEGAILPNVTYKIVKARILNKLTQRVTITKTTTAMQNNDNRSTLTVGRESKTSKYSVLQPDLKGSLFIGLLRFKSNVRNR